METSLLDETLKQISSERNKDSLDILFLSLFYPKQRSGSMRAPFCNESTDLCPEEKGITLSENDSKQEIDRSLVKPTGIKKNGVFGICLDDLMGTTPQVAPQIPFILTRLCRYIETHGLRQKRLFMKGDEKHVIENLKTEFTECGDASLESANVASAAKILIIFFQELPEPLIPVSAQTDFIKDMENLSLSSSDCINHLKHNVGKLPDSVYQVLKYLSRFLSRVSSHEEYNGMNSNSLAFIFCPVIFRCTSSDPGVHLILKDVMNCFVRDYHLIFEEDSRLTDQQKPSDGCYQQPPSLTDMPAMSPLSVLIPPMDTTVEEEDETKVPVLLIEAEIEPANEIARPNKFPSSIKDTMGLCMNRKRKERRLSGEDLQPRSNSEERPTQGSLASTEKIDILRRCNSHEGVDYKNEDVFDKGSMDKEESSSHVDSYLTEAMELVTNEKNHSPHPPNAKRREVDTDSSTMSSSSDHWKQSSLSAFTEYKKSLSDTPRWRDSKQNPSAEFPEKRSMDFNEEDYEAFDNTRSSIPRSASCPVPNSTDNDSNSESQSSSLSMSWSMLFEDTEPVRSEQPLGWSLSKQVQDDALVSPSVQKLRSNNNFYEAPLSPSAYKSYLSHRSSHLDASVPPSPPVEQEDFAKLVESSGVSDSIKHLTKKIHNIKRRVRKFDDKFEAEFGYKPSHAEKSNNPEAKKLLSDLYKARKELKALKEEAHLDHVSSSTSGFYASHILGDTTNRFLQENERNRTNPSVEDSLGLTLKSLADERLCANRPELVEAMTSDQVKDEKLSIQKALLHFESIHEKPFTKSERNSMRPLYDRYRSVKKLLVRSGSFPGSVSKNKELCSELQPILEHETMDFPSREIANVQIECEKEETEKVENVPIEESETPLEGGDTKGNSLSCFLTKYDNSNFHELPLSEMIFQMQKVKSEKRHIRKILREFEAEFLRLNGRKVLKEDKAPVNTLYGEYKHVKARLKLLEALISKHDQHQLM
ncbi:hypothetical protein JTE90_009633 [Oedothorax gibbosus]|uniref:Rho-GAP domain-containing protein n=1 Tax=Oedothorax gibbosus TaxID=931172 RepID=A0AAV6VC00_9ARAC|nr:hypothetical protein JTE90_009633 [Oedothorax gibbosus]